MVSLQRVIEYLHPNAVPLRDYAVTSRRGVEVVTHWDAAALGPQPTPQQLATVAASPAFQQWLASLAKTKRKARMRELLASREDLVVLLRDGVVRVLYQSLVETRAAYNALRNQLMNAGIPITAPALQNRPWEQIQQAAAASADSAVDSEV